MPRTATWRSGYATVCKTVYPGSIPGVASSPPQHRDALLFPAVEGHTHILGWRAGTLGKGVTHCYRPSAINAAPFPGSSVVEQPAVNRLVAGSNPARGATLSQKLRNRDGSCRAIFFCIWGHTVNFE